MIRYDFDKREGQPLYEYLYDCLKNDILSGHLTAGMKLPSKREFARENNISVKTVIHAYEQLVVEGYLYSEEKRGYFVADVETVSEYRSEPAEYEPVYEEETWFADFTVNNTAYEKFPFTQWRKVMREVLSEYDVELVRRAHFQGIKELRTAIAEYLYRTRKMQVSPECIIIGSGIEYLYNRLMKILPQDAIYAVESPGSKKIPGIYDEFGVTWTPVPMNENGIDMDSLREKGADVIHVSPEHSYPLGTVMTVARRQELLEWCARKMERYIIEDDYDCEFRYNSRMIPTLYSMDTQHRVIYMNTFSKTLAPSLRISYMILPEKLMRRYLESATFYSNTASTCEQYALAKFIDRKYFERHVSRLKKHYSAQRDLLIQIIREAKHLPVKEIGGTDCGTHLLIWLDTGLADIELKWLAKQQKIHIEFLSEFCAETEERYQHIMILNYSELNEEILREAVRRLDAVFQFISA